MQGPGQGRWLGPGSKSTSTVRWAGGSQVGGSGWAVTPSRLSQSQVLCISSGTGARTYTPWLAGGTWASGNGPGRALRLRRREKLLPRPGSLVRLMVPPIIVLRLRPMARPSPAPASRLGSRTW